VPEVVNTAVIKAPAAAIFAYIAQAERNVDWVPDLQRSERLTPGETRIGTRFRFLTKIAGFPVDVTDEVVQLVPDRFIAFRGVTGPTHAGSWTFQPEGDGSQTRVTYRMQFELPPGVGPIVARMLNLEQKLDDQSRACLANLRRILE
jgi:uncharacterized protein YndB with AHSA1/START domain